MTALSVTAPLNFVLLQASFVAKIYKGMLDTSMQIGNLNVTASRKLLEESSSAATKAMTVKTPWDMQTFLLEQSQLAYARMDGYRRNVQEIAASGQGGLAALSEARATQQRTQQEPARDEDRMAATHTASNHQHEVDPHPSALVEKLISSAVSDSDATLQ
jgi:hypothetical protein